VNLYWNRIFCTIVCNVKVRNIVRDLGARCHGIFRGDIYRNVREDCEETVDKLIPDIKQDNWMIHSVILSCMKLMILGRYFLEECCVCRQVMSGRVKLFLSKDESWPRGIYIFFSEDNFWQIGIFFSLNNSRSRGIFLSKYSWPRGYVCWAVRF
jgi:hypothetical protein